jgi:hypothetical protein
MLTYHPAFDSYHCAYRILLLTTKISSDVIEVERLRIWDFYFVFPHQARNISFPIDLGLFRKTFNFKPNPYEDILDAQRIFERMKPFQVAALKYLAAYGLIDSEQLSDNLIKRTTKPIPRVLLEHMNRLDSQQEAIISLMQSPLNDLSLYGEKGLKYRTKILDYKYDAD